MPFWRYFIAVALICSAQTHAHGQGNPNSRRPFYPEGVTAITFSPDGKLLVAGCFDETVTLWDAVIGKEKLRFKAHQGGVFAVAFSPDGKWVLSAGADKVIRIWDTASGKELGTLTGHDGDVTCLKYSADGKELISGSADKTIRVWDVIARKEARKIAGHPDGVFGLGFTGDNQLVSTGAKTVEYKLAGGSTVISTEADTPVVWNLTTGEKTRVYDIGANQAAFSCDGRFFAVTGMKFEVKGGGFTGTAFYALHDAATGERLTNLEGMHDDALAFSPDGKILAGFHRNGGLCFWEAATGQVIYRQANIKGTLLTFSADGKRLAWADPGTPGFDPDPKAPKVRFLDLPPQQMQSDKSNQATKPSELWDALALKDSAAAYQAVLKLAAMPAAAVALLKPHFTSAAAAHDSARIDKLIADLNSDKYTVRKTAETELRKLSFAVETPLRKALESGTSPLEVRTRTQSILADLTFPLDGEAVREVRALHVLEIIGTPEAEAAIQILADSRAPSRLVDDAKRVLKRMRGGG